MAVEDVALQRLQGGGQAVYLQRWCAAGDAGGGHGVDEQGQAGDVVEVGVGQDDVLHAGHFVDAEVAHAGAGVDEDVVVEQKGCGAAALRNGAGTA